MQIKKSVSTLFNFTIFLLVFSINIASANLDYYNEKLKSRTDNFISKNDRYKIFNVHMKINQILEKLDELDFEKTKYKQLLFIDSILNTSIKNYIEYNSKSKIESKLKDIIKAKGENINNFNISKIELIEYRTYTPIWRVFYKTKIEFSNNSRLQVEYINVFYNGDIGVYYRPQENQFSTGYINKDLMINLENKKIAGTLSYNNSRSSQKLIILTTGGGENDRDFLSSKHRINVVLSNYLNSLGYAVFRYDKSSIGSSTGDNYMNLTSEDLANDLDGVVKYFKTQSQVSIGSIGLLGHSEGGIISSIVASKSNDISFLIMLGAPYSSLENMLKDGSINLGIDNLSSDIKQKIKNNLIALVDILKSKKSSEEAYISIENYKESLSPGDKILFSIIEKNLPFGDMDDLSSTWFRYYLTLDVRDYLKNIKIPTLILNGDKDFIIDSTKMGDIEKTIKNNNSKSELKILENTGHMMENNTTRTDDDYSSKNETISKNVFEEIGSWVREF